MDNGHAPILSVRNLKTYFFQDEGTVHAVDGASFESTGQDAGHRRRERLRQERHRALGPAHRRAPGRIVEGEIICVAHRPTGRQTSST